MAMIYYCKHFLHLLLTATCISVWLTDGCNLNRFQCREEFHSGNKSERYQTECYETKNAFGEFSVRACVDTCDPAIQISQYIIKCEDFCNKGKFNK